ncbi:MAG: pyridoxamine 5'-phosphate oxidase family protein [Betaproteobacteria bacterium]
MQIASRSLSKDRELKNENMFPSEDMARDAVRVWSIAKAIKVAMVSSRDRLTRDPEMPDLATGKVPDRLGDHTADTLVTRPLRARFQDDSSVIWFILPRRSALAGMSSSEDAQTMMVTFSNGGEGDHIVFEGVASLSEDRAIMASLWDSHAEIHFPKGAKDLAAVLIRFEPHSARFWTGGQDFVSFVVHYITAKMTGEPQKVGTHGMVSPL